MFPGRFHLAARARPVRLISDLPTGPDPRIPSLALEVEVNGSGTTTVGWSSGRLRLEGWYDASQGRAGLDLVIGDERSRHVSRRRRRITDRPDGLGISLTGTQVSVLTRHGDTWTVRAKLDLHREGIPLDVAALVPHHSAPVRATGRFGQLGLRDLHLVTAADGSPYQRDGLLFLTATHAGPGFFATAHCGVWAFDPETFALEHRADLWFERDGRVVGDHAVHLVHDGESWLVAASTWGDFDHDDVGITLTRSTADLLHGEHVLTPTPLDLGHAIDEGVAVWDPHLTVIDGHWHLACVLASEFFVFRPILLRGRRAAHLDDWELIGDATGRVATEGTQIVRIGPDWRVLASDGPDNPSGLRRRFPVFDLSLREVATLDAPYPSNLPWPTLVQHGEEWLMLTFDGTPHGGPVAGYGTHGDFLVFRANQSGAGSVPPDDTPFEEDPA